MTQAVAAASAHQQCYAQGSEPPASKVAADIIAKHTTTVEGLFLTPDRQIVDSPALAAELKAFGDANPQMASAVRAEAKAQLPATEAVQLGKELAKVDAWSVSMVPEGQRREGMDVMFAKANGSVTSTPERLSARGEFSTGMFASNHVAQGSVLSVPGGASHQMNVMTLNAKAQLDVSGNGLGAKGQVAATMIEQKGALFVGRDAENPAAQAEGSYALMKAEANGDFLLGDDGTRTGIILEGGVSAVAAQGRVGGEINVPAYLASPVVAYFLGFDADDTVSIRLGLTGEAGAATASGGAHAYYDSETERYNLGGSLLASLTAGAGFDLNISAGSPHTSRDR